jgi:sec-independent protein translocase protein TatB
MAVILVGPNRLPVLAGKLARVVASVRSFVGHAQERIRIQADGEVDLDWRRFDPARDHPAALAAKFDAPPPTIPGTPTDSETDVHHG